MRIRLPAQELFYSGILCSICLLALTFRIDMAAGQGEGGGELPVCRPVRTAAAPTIDGNLSDACYANAPVLSNFTVLNKGTAATEQTEVRVAFDEEHLYFAVRCHESQMGKGVGNASGRDANVFADDCVEIFFDANHDHFTYRQFAVSLSGATWDGAGDAAGISPEANLKWSAKTAKAADGWTAEVAIPFASLGLTQHATSTFGLNIAREEKPKGELSSWVPSKDKFGVPPKFGHLEGLTVDLNPCKVGLVLDAPRAAILGRNTVRVAVANASGIPRSLTLGIRLQPPKELPRTWSEPARSFKPGESFTYSVPIDLMESGPHALDFTVTDADSKRVVANLGKEIAVASLAEFSLFPSHYRREATLLCRLNVTPEKYAQYSLLVRLTNPGKDDDHRTHSVRSLKNAVTQVRLPYGNLRLGEYPVKATLLDAEDKVAAEAAFSLAIFPKADTTPLVSIGQDNTLLVQGKPFFPIGIYEMPATEKTIKDAAEAGFNLMLAGGGGSPSTTRVLDRAEQYNVKMWVVMGHLMDLSKETEKRKQLMQETVAAVGSHPALLVWESIDEPAWGEQSADGLIAGYRCLRSLDLNHPVWTNHAPRNTVATLAYYNQATDVAGCDVYPLPEPQQQSDLPNKTLAVVGDEADKSATTVNREKPIFMVLQGFGWAELSGGDKTKAVMPTFEQSRFMAYNAIVHGANGILYWGTHYTRKPSKFFSELKTLVSELKGMSPVFLGKRVTAPRVHSEPAGAERIVRKLKGETFLIVTNTKAARTRVTLTKLALREGQTLRLLYDEGKPEVLKVRRGQVTFDVEGHGVKAFTTSTAFSPTRKDFSQEYLQARPSADTDLSLMREEGNLIENPSFEVDANDDALPDRWAPQAAFVAERSAEAAHTGKSSLAIHNEDEAAAPLLVQYGIPAADNRPHVLSAWAKTDQPGVEYRIYAEWVVDGRFHSRVLPWAKGTGEWEQAKLSFTTSPDPQGKLYVVVQLKGKGKVWFDDVSLKESP